MIKIETMSDINSVERAEQLYQEILWMSKESYGSISEFMRAQKRPVRHINNIRSNGKKTGKVPDSAIAEMEGFIVILKKKKLSYKKVVTEEMIDSILKKVKEQYRFIRNFCKDRPEYSYMFMINLKDKAGQKITRKVKTLLKLFDLYDKYYSNEKPKNKTVRAKAKDRQ